MKTALILAGGSGTRLSPVTLTLNKSLVPINGEPILRRLIFQLDSIGIEKIVVLAGHLSWQVELFLKSIIKELKCELQVLSTPAEFSPAERLLRGAEAWKNSSEILLMYCDNLIDDDDLQKLFDESRYHQVVAQRRIPGNIYFGNNGNIRYTVSRSNSNPLVELGYWRLHPRIFHDILLEKRQLPETLEIYTSNQHINALEVESYFSASDLMRYLKQRMNNRRTILLDRDGILVRSVSKGEYLRKPEQIRIIKENVDHLKMLSSRFRADFVVVTNQAGIERKLLTFDEVHLVNQTIAIQMLIEGVSILAFYTCPHHWDTNCLCRKPEPGLINQAIRELGLDPSRTPIIGDRTSDIAAGKNAGIQAYQITEQMTSSERSRIFEEIIQFMIDSELTP